jgi:citrate lyase synthetase
MVLIKHYLIKMIIEKFREDQAEACSKIMIDCINNSLHYTGDNKDFMLMVSQPKEVIKKAHKIDFFVYMEEGKVLGMGGFEEGEIKTMFVDPTLQKKGVGSKILKSLMELGRLRNFEKLFLKSSPEAEKFYERHGFKKIRDDYAYDFHSIIMEKIL